jgi:hypothetical protein
MPALSREEREALIARFKELKRQGEPDLESLLDTQVRRRFGALIYRAIAATRQPDKP